MPHPAINLEHLPPAGSILLGREQQLNQITATLKEQSCNLLTILGEDGLGKTSLINHWLHENESVLSGQFRVYGWSFYNQGSVANKTVPSDFFVEDALRWLNAPNPSRGSAWDRGRRLGQLVKQQPTLLVLDGVELLQFARGSQAGHINDPTMQTLLAELAVDNPGLTVLTTRLPLTNLWNLPADSHRTVTLEPFSPDTGAAFLQAQGIDADNHSLREVSRAFEGHPLALSLLAAFLRDALAGDLSRVDEIPPVPDDSRRGGQARRVLQAYADWFGDSPELNILHLVGLFTRPAELEILEELREPPGIPQLTDHFFRQTEDRMFGFFPKKRDIALDEEIWDEAVANLRRAGLLLPPKTPPPADGEPETGYLDAHPVVRRFFARQLGTEYPKAWQAGQQRLYEHLAEAVETYPDTLMEMRPLYHALAHACRGGLAEEALEKIYWERISRKEVFYSSKQLGAFGADLAGLANAFSKPWHTPVQSLPKFTWAALLNWTGTALRALGRLDEARQPLETALTTYRSKKDWKQVSVAAANLSMLGLLLGDIEMALQTSEESVRRAKKARDENQRMLALSARAEALLKAGDREAAAEVFAELEQKQRMWQADYRYLYSRRGYHYCDLLLSREEFAEVIERAGQTIEVARAQGWPMYEALDHLSLGRARLALTELKAAGEHFVKAVEILQQEGAREFLPPALLGRAAWHRAQGEWPAAQADIEAALEIIVPDGMKLFEADAYLSRAWLALAQAERPTAEKYLGRATAIISETGYHRRDDEAVQLTDRLSTAADQPQN